MRCLEPRVLALMPVLGHPNNSVTSGTSVVGILPLCLMWGPQVTASGPVRLTVGQDMSQLGIFQTPVMGRTDFLISLELHTSLEVGNSPEFIAVMKRNMTYNHKETIKSLSRQNL